LVGRLAEWFARRKSGPSKTEPATAPVRTDAEEIVAALDQLHAQVAGVPAIIEARVDRIVSTIRETVPRLDRLGAGSTSAYDVLRIATSYLPEALAAYLRLPRDFADNRPVSNGKSSLAVLCDQLDLLASRMNQVFDAVCRADADALIAHGRFLAEKFGAGSLALDPLAK
jgi:hypothetical protein